LVLENRNEGSDIEVFKRNLLLLLNDKPELTRGELEKHYDMLQKEKQQTIAQEAYAANIKKISDREEKTELEKIKRYEEEKGKKEVLLTSINTNSNCLTDYDLILKKKKTLRYN
jgi:hypothetical protein